MGTIIDFVTEGTIGLSLRPKRYDIELYQGDTFEAVVLFKGAGAVAIDLTGIGFDCRLVPVANGAPPVTQPTATMGPNLGEVTILIVDTSSLSGAYNWDLQLTNGTRKRTYIGGSVTVTSDITT